MTAFEKNLPLRNISLDEYLSLLQIEHSHNDYHVHFDEQEKEEESHSLVSLPIPDKTSSQKTDQKVSN